MTNSSRYVTEQEKRIPVADEYDVVVVGGGIAGVAAAVAAGRNGAQVALIEKENALGGLATLGLVVYYLPLCDGRGNQVIAGLGEELLKLSLKYGPGEIPSCWRGEGSRKEKIDQRYRVEFNPAAFILSLEEIVLENNVVPFYDTRFCDLLLEQQRIEAVILENKSGRIALRCGAAIDATGDADLCHRAGENTVSLETNRITGWFYSTGEEGIKLHKLHDPLYEPPPPGRETFAGDRGRAVTEMNIASRKMILAHLEKLNADQEQGPEYPLLLPVIPQFRMTRRLKAGFELEEKDEGQFFTDTVGMTGDWRRPGPVYSLPYRAIRAEKTENLLTAGRCISAEKSAWDITRAIPTCAVTGQAAGTAAALSVRAGAGVRDLDCGHLQQTLKDQGTIINPALCG